MKTKKKKAVKKTTMRRVVIDRAKWRPGMLGLDPNLFGLPALLNAKGRMCCLGFAAQQLGDVPAEVLLGKAMPEHLTKAITGLSRTVCGIDGVRNVADTNFSIKAAGLNDDVRVPLKEKEKRLRALFAKHNIRLVFTGEYSSPYREADAKLRALLKEKKKAKKEAVTSW